MFSVRSPVQSYCIFFDFYSKFNSFSVEQSNTDKTRNGHILGTFDIKKKSGSILACRFEPGTFNELGGGFTFKDTISPEMKRTKARLTLNCLKKSEVLDDLFPVKLKKQFEFKKLHIPSDKKIQFSKLLKSRYALERQ